MSAATLVTVVLYTVLDSEVLQAEVTRTAKFYIVRSAPAIRGTFWKSRRIRKDDPKFRLTRTGAIAAEVDRIEQSIHRAQRKIQRLGDALQRVKDL